MYKLYNKFSDKAILLKENRQNIGITNAFNNILDKNYSSIWEINVYKGKCYGRN